MTTTEMIIFCCVFVITFIVGIAYDKITAAAVIFYGISAITFVICVAYNKTIKK